MARETLNRSRDQYTFIADQSVSDRTLNLSTVVVLNDFSNGAFKWLTAVLNESASGTACDGLTLVLDQTFAF